MLTENLKANNEHSTSNSVPPHLPVHTPGPELQYRSAQSMEEFQVNRAPFMQAKDYDHEDTDVEFTADRTLTIIANILASIGVFALLMLAIAMMMQFPDMWLSKTLIALWRGL